MPRPTFLGLAFARTTKWGVARVPLVFIKSDAAFWGVPIQGTRETPRQNHPLQNTTPTLGAVTMGQSAILLLGNPNTT